MVIDRLLAIISHDSEDTVMAYTVKPDKLFELKKLVVTDYINIFKLF